MNFVLYVKENVIEWYFWILLVNIWVLNILLGIIVNNMYIDLMIFDIIFL